MTKIFVVVETPLCRNQTNRLVPTPNKNSPKIQTASIVHTTGTHANVPTNEPTNTSTRTLTQTMMIIFFYKQQVMTTTHSVKKRIQLNFQLIFQFHLIDTMHAETRNVSLFTILQHILTLSRVLKCNDSDSPASTQLPTQNATRYLSSCTLIFHCFLRVSSCCFNIVDGLFHVMFYPVDHFSLNITIPTKPQSVNTFYYQSHNQNQI